MSIRVVDVFAGPGGLNEGFASFTANGERPFKIMKSIEKDPVACQTLRLRAALRDVADGNDRLPPQYVSAIRREQATAILALDSKFGAALERAKEHVWEFTLDASTRDESDREIASAVAGNDPWVLVGGPPCQLYSLVGRARASRLSGFKDDVRHVLYKEYLHIIEAHQPDAFVMENVKGMLSATHHEGKIFELIREDVAQLGYELRSFIVEGDELAPSDFVIRSEKFGIPQRRHRVILFGIRSRDVQRTVTQLRESEVVSVADAIRQLPKIRSRISPTSRDRLDEWSTQRLVGLSLAGYDAQKRRTPQSWGGAFHPSSAKPPKTAVQPYHDFVGTHTEQIEGFIQHMSRSHMPADIRRYAYYSAKHQSEGRSVRVNDLPEALLPKHKNVGRSDTPFTDRFRVQGWKNPSTTIVSHIAKDGHYFIHPDPIQARSLTVREAARLQTFPDDYYFCGSRTQQFHQVGNAVPPLLAHQIAKVVHDFLAQ